MSVFDIKQMAKEIAFRDTEHPSTREVIVLRFVETAVLLVNNPHLIDRELDTMTEVYEIQYGMIMVDQQVLDLVKLIKRNMRKDGWDPRVKIKLEEKKLSNSFHRASIVMDLDTTINEAIEEDSAFRLASVEPEDINDTVSDTPPADMLNEFDSVLRSRSTPRTPLLSDRNAQFVIEDSGRNWGS